MTQAGIADGAQILRSHVPRTLRSLASEGFIQSEDARLLGRTRKARVYRLTEAGVRRAREVLTALDAMSVDVDGRRMTLGEARRELGLSPISARAAMDAKGRLQAVTTMREEATLIGRDEDVAFLRRWRTGPSVVAVVYGSRGMGKTALGRAFARTIPKTVWIDLGDVPDLEALAVAIERATGRAAEDSADPRSVAQTMLTLFETETKLLILDGYAEAAEDVVEALSTLVRIARGGARAKVLVLAQETTPAYCRFYGRKDVESGTVVERHLKGLDLDGCCALLGNPSIDAEALRRIYLLTKGCPLYLKLIREGDEDGLRAHSRFTKAEIRLLLYSGGALGAATSVN